MFTRMALGIAIACAAFSAQSQTAQAAQAAQAVTDVQTTKVGGGYAQDGKGNVVRSEFGLCWRSGYWNDGDAVTGCDGALAPPIAKPTAPAFVAAPALVPAAAAPTVSTAAISATAPGRCDFAVTLPGDASFGFDKAVLSKQARQRLDTDVISRLAGCPGTGLAVTGHSDRMGSPQHNLKLSEQRARAVAAYLKQKGIAADIKIAGAGAAQAVKACDGRQKHAALIACLAPNRRVVIEAR